MTEKGLSKSKYTKFRQCPKALWLRVYSPEKAVEDAQAESRFAAGNAVGDLAMELFGNYTEVTTHKPDSSLDLKAMLEKTQQCLSNGTNIICEASFTHNGCYCAVDILKKTDNGYAIYEVKSSSASEEEEKAKKDKLQVYAQDIAYQKWALTQCGVNVTGTYLVRLNSDYVRGDELDISQLFIITDMADDVTKEYPLIEHFINNARQTLQSPTEPEAPLTEYCHKPYHCEFWDYCAQLHQLPTPSVFDLYRKPFSGKLKLYNKGKVKFDDITDEKLSDFQQMQVECTISGTTHIDREEIAKFLKKLSYPLYFLDFETMQVVIPQYKGTRPYQQITFQYSLHYIEKEGGELKHKEFLGESGTDPRRALAEQLCRDIPKNVCVTAYNKSFECTRIKELADAFPNLREHLLNIRSHIVDLWDPFKDGHYYTPAMGGSTSIKHVLPALWPDEPSLDYHNLDSRCQNGGHAMTIFPLIKDMEPAEQQATRQALLDYCCLDTYAMVKVWEKLKEVLNS
ncbi:MAG: DUF2779 domain-containing protein [Paludibacteraceae bacterium]|nr:DUF2779 domain-containing protein [Paludibacteraceae bacterium]